MFRQRQVHKSNVIEGVSVFISGTQLYRKKKVLRARLLKQWLEERCKKTSLSHGTE